MKNPGMKAPAFFTLFSVCIFDLILFYYNDLNISKEMVNENRNSLLQSVKLQTRCRRSGGRIEEKAGC